MPAVRASTWAATAAATGTTLTIPTPYYEVGDLLLAVFMADTGTGTWTAPGWSHVSGSPSTNTAQLVCMWKYAAAGEAESHTFTRSVVESFNGSIISIRDVHPTTPFGATPVVGFESPANAARMALPQIVTNVNNALVIYAAAYSAGSSTPSIIEGPVSSIVAADGLAEGIGAAWGFQAVAGPTPANVRLSAGVNTGSACRTMALQIAPPAAGAAVVPAYCAEDLSVMLSPLIGGTPFNGDAAWSATADTGFGATVGGQPVADGVASTAADVGINPFHSVSRLTSVAGATTFGAAELVFAAGNRPNIAGKNVLVHVGPSTEGQLQRFSTVASGRGMWAGFRSGSATDFKLWQVYGADHGAARHQPVVINTAAGNVKAAAGALDAGAVHAFGVFISGTGASSSTTWDFAMLWALDVVTVCGGNAAEPVGVPGVVAAVASGHERRSALRQGARQMVAYQPVQFGNGGVAPVFLDLNATAIEFPRQYDVAAGEVSYNSVDDVVGLTYYGGAGDTVKHRNSVVSSPSKFHWRIHASASASAAWDFSGLSVIGAGDVQLRQVTTFTGMSFASCPTIEQNGASIANSTFRGSHITAGNPGAISGCQFVSGGAGHAITITAPGTYTFSGNTFSGYGASGSTDAAIYNNSGGAVVLNVAAGGSTPTVRNGAGATTTVNSGATLTLTGIVPGSDVVILDAGTSIERVNVDANAGSTYGYSYTAGGSVDIGVFRVGYVPFYIRGYTLSGTDAALPIAQVADRNYSNP